MSAPASTAASTSSWRVRPHTLTSGRETSSRSFAPGSGARISVEPTRIAFAPASSAAAACARVSMPLSAITIGPSAHLRPARAGRAVDREVGEVAGVDTDHGRFQFGGPRELLRVVRFDERVEAKRARPHGAVRSRPGRQVAQQDSTASAPASRACSKSAGDEKKPLASSGSRVTAARREVVPGAAEPLVDEHRHGACSRRVVGASDLRDVAVRAEVARRRRAPLELGDRAEARRGERVLEPHATTASCENAISWSRRAAAAPESSASRRAPAFLEVVCVAARRDRTRCIEKDRRAPAAVAALRRPRGSSARSPPATRRAARRGRSARCRGRAGRSRVAHVTVDDLADEVRAGG